MTTILTQPLEELQHWARKPRGYDYSTYAPVRHICSTCHTFSLIPRVDVEATHEYKCPSCGVVMDGLFVIPDPAQTISVGRGQMMVIDVYLN